MTSSHKRAVKYEHRWCVSLQSPGGWVYSCSVLILPFCQERGPWGQRQGMEGDSDVPEFLHGRTFTPTTWRKNKLYNIKPKKSRLSLVKVVCITLNEACRKKVVLKKKTKNDYWNQCRNWESESRVRRYSRLGKWSSSPLRWMVSSWPSGGGWVMFERPGTTEEVGSDLTYLEKRN